MGHQLSSSHIKSPCFELVFPRSAALCLPAAASRSHQRSWPRATLELSELEVLLLLMHSASAKRDPRGRAGKTQGSAREDQERTSTHEGARVVHRRDDEDLWQRRREELKSWQDEAVSLSINYRQHV